MVQPKLKFWGWGYEGDVLAPDEVRWLERMLAKQFRISQFDLTPPPTAEDIRLCPSRLTIPAALLGICTTEHYERLLHSYGSSFLDSVRTFASDFSHPPDVIAYPRHAQDVLALLDWCYDVGAAVIPFGGGTSVHLDGISILSSSRPFMRFWWCAMAEAEQVHSLTGSPQNPQGHRLIETMSLQLAG